MGTVTDSFIRIMTGAALLLVLGSSDAEALTVKNATVSLGVVSVSGGQAARYAQISWEGTIVTTANKGGGFTFTTAVVPTNCVGTLSDGISHVSVVISGCGGTISPLPPTGRTISYAAGDDGYFNATRPLSYTDSGDGTITDNSTGLIWGEEDRGERQRGVQLVCGP